MKKLILTCCCSILGLGATSLFAQQGIVSAGGNASGTGGVVSFSIGQVFYSSPSSATFNLVYGIQQPYEISEVTGIGESALGVKLNALAFPNPAIDQLTLKIENGYWNTYTYALFDMSGRLLMTNKVEGTETHLDMSTLAPAEYSLSVYNADHIAIKSFKIIKTY